MSRRRTPRKMDSVLGLLNLHNTGRLFFALYFDRRVPWTYKAYAASGITYFLSPLDTVPHDFTGNSLVDDLIVVLVIMQTFIDYAPREVMEEHCERLKIDPERVVFNVPQTVKEALEMFQAWKGVAKGQPQGSAQWGQGPMGPGMAPGWYYYGPPQGGQFGAWGPPGAAPEEEPPPFTRYSAYREGEDE